MRRRKFTAYVAFYGADHNGFWRIFTKRGWRHVAVLLPVYEEGPFLDAPVKSILINPQTWGIDVKFINCHPKEACQRELDGIATMALEVPVDLDFKRAYVARGLIHCVSVVKAVLGIRGGWYVWTPAHLCRFLIRNGATILEKD